MNQTEIIASILDAAYVKTLWPPVDALNVVERVKCLVFEYVAALRERDDASAHAAEETVARQEAEGEAGCRLKHELDRAHAIEETINRCLDRHHAPAAGGIPPYDANISFTTDRIDRLVTMLREEADKRCREAEDELAEITRTLDRCDIGDPLVTRASRILDADQTIDTSYTATIEDCHGDRRIRRTVTAASLSAAVQGLQELRNLGLSSAEKEGD